MHYTSETLERIFIMYELNSQLYICYALYQRNTGAYIYNVRAQQSALYLLRGIQAKHWSDLKCTSSTDQLRIYKEGVGSQKKNFDSFCMYPAVFPIASVRKSIMASWTSNPSDYAVRVPREPPC